MLRKGSQSKKQAILYEVISEDTAEERTSERRREVGAGFKPAPTSPWRLVYGTGELQTRRAAEDSGTYCPVPEESKSEQKESGEEMAK